MRRYVTDRWKKVSLVFFVIGVSGAHAQTLEPIQSEYEAAKEQYRGAIRAAGASQAKKSQARQRYRERLSELTTDWFTRPDECFTAADRLAVATVATELADWQQVVAVADSAPANERGSFALLRLATNACLRLGMLDAAEELFADLCRAPSAGEDVGALHITFANAYQHAGCAAQSREHLSRFMAYVVRSLPSSPQLGAAMRSLVARYRSAAGSDHASFLQELSAQTRAMIADLKSPSTDNRASVSLAHHAGIFQAALAIASEVSEDDLGPMLHQWIDMCDCATVSQKETSLADQHTIAVLCESVGHYSILLKEPQQLDVLRQSMHSLATHLSAPTRSVAPETRKRLTSSVKLLDIRRAHLNCLGLTIDKDELAQLQLPKSNLTDGPLLLCFWSPLLSDAEEVLATLERTTTKHPQVRLAVVLPYRRSAVNDPVAITKEDRNLDRLRQRLSSSRVGPISLVDVKIPFIMRLCVGPLPQFVVMDKHLTIREIVVGNDALRIAQIGRGLERIEKEEAAPQCSAVGQEDR